MLTLSLSPIMALGRRRINAIGETVTLEIADAADALAQLPTLN